MEHSEAQRQTLERLYQRKATLEALIQSLEGVCPLPLLCRSHRVSPFVKIRLLLSCALSRT